MFHSINCWLYLPCQNLWWTRWRCRVYCKFVCPSIWNKIQILIPEFRSWPDIFTNFIWIFICSATCLNRTHWLLDSAPTAALAELLMYVATILLLNRKPFNTKRRINFMQYSQPEVRLFIIDTTAWLSQCTRTLIFLSWNSQVNTPAHRANNSRNSILGLFEATKPTSQVPQIHCLPRIQPKPKLFHALASEKKPN